MKKRLVLLYIILCTIIILPKPTYADMFSKPTATIEIKGVQKPYDFELLIPYNSKAEVLELEDYEYRLDYYYKSTYPVDVFNGYQDADGFVARTIYSAGAPTHLSLVKAEIYHVGYYSAPRIFKIAIVIDEDIVISSPIIHRRMFTSEIVFNLNNVDLSVSTLNAGVVTEVIPMDHFFSQYALRVILTIVLELIILFVFTYRMQKSFLIVGLTNFITQSILTIIMIVGFYFWAAEVGLVVTLVLGEIFVFVVEGITYVFLLKENSKKRALLYALIANLVTLLFTIFTLSYF